DKKSTHKLYRANARLPQAERHQIHLGFMVFCSALLQHQTLKLSLIENEAFQRQREIITCALRAHRTTLQKILARISLCGMILLTLSGLGTTVATFSTLLAGYPILLVQTICLIMMISNSWARFKMHQGMGYL